MARPLKTFSLSLILLALSFPFSQTQNKLIEWRERPAGRNNERWGEGLEGLRVLDKVEIETLKIGGEEIPFGKEFGAGEDWLRELVIRVRNVYVCPLLRQP